MNKKLVLVIVTVLAIVLTIASRSLVQHTREDTLTNLGGFADPICIQSEITDKGFPLAWKKGIAKCSEKDAHHAVGVYDNGSISVSAFVADTVIYLAALIVLLKIIPIKNKKHLL